jgi:hypothetical protein
MQFVHSLFGHKKSKTNKQYHKGSIAVVMFAKTMAKGMYAYSKGYQYHAPLKPGVMQYIDTQQWKTGKKQGKNGTMNSTGQRSPNS